MTDANAFIDEVQSRLLRMTAQPSFRFQNTTRANAARYLEQLQTFEGFSEDAVFQAEKRVGGRLPEVYRSFLLRMGRRSGELFRGSDLLDLDHPEETDEVVREILDTSPGFVLLPHTHILLTHQGYSFDYTRAEGEFDAPVWWFDEGNTAPGDRAPSFAELLDQSLLWMEKLHHDQHETGGHFLEVGEGYVCETHPARVSGERPLDQPERFVEAGESLSSSGELFRKFLGKLNPEKK